MLDQFVEVSEKSGKKFFSLRKTLFKMIDFDTL